MDLKINNLDELIEFLETYETSHEDRARLIKSTIGLLTTTKDRGKTIEQLKTHREKGTKKGWMFLGDFSIRELEATGLIKFVE